MPATMLSRPFSLSLLLPNSSTCINAPYCWYIDVTYMLCVSSPLTVHSNFQPSMADVAWRHFLHEIVTRLAWRQPLQRLSTSYNAAYTTSDTQRVY